MDVQRQQLIAIDKQRKLSTLEQNIMQRESVIYLQSDGHDPELLQLLENLSDGSIQLAGNSALPVR